jgi:hypothetical protein
MFACSKVKKKGEHMKYKKLLLFLGAVGLIAAFVSYKVNETIIYLQQNIEERALPVLRKDIPLFKRKLFGFIPSTQSILDKVKLGPIDAGKLHDKTVDFVAQPFITRALEKTRQDLNKELSYIAIKDLTYDKHDKQKTITAYCSYGITVILTGHHFKKITSTDRQGFILTFMCD